MSMESKNNMLKIIKKSYDEYWGYYWRVTSRHQIPGIFEWDRNLVSLIEEKCSLTPGMRVLDLGCAGGDQAKVFAQKGYDVLGIDMVESLIHFAKEAFKKEKLDGTFIAKDMREINYQNEFDLCVLLSGTFGMLSEEETIQLLQNIKKALKKGGKVFMQYLSTHRFSSMKLQKTWHEIENGFHLGEHWYDAKTNTYRSRNKHIMMDGTIIEPETEPGYHANEIIQCYTVPEITKLLKNAGFEVVDHLSRSQIDTPKKEPADWETREIVIAKKQQ